MKRKLSLGLMIVVALLVLSIGALAATILSGKVFVAEMIGPKARENVGEAEWTPEEIEDILRIVADYGIPLSEEQLQRLENFSYQSKREVMELFVRPELGFDPDTWRIEDQAWYDQLLVDCGLRSERSRFLPEKGELTGEEALEKANGFVREALEVDGSFEDPTRYQRRMTYQNILWYKEDTPEAGPESIRGWRIEYLPLDASHAAYSVYITPEGKVSGGITEMSGMEEEIPTPEALLQSMEDTYLEPYTWEPRLWVSFHEMLERSVALHGPGEDAFFAHVLRQRYAMPANDAISQMEAHNRALITLSKEGLITPADQQAEGMWTDALYLLEEDDTPVWKVIIRYGGKSCYLAEVHALTGEVHHVASFEDGPPLYQMVTLRSVQAEMTTPR